MRIVGVDLAWGEQKGDGLAWVDMEGRLERARLAGVCNSLGDDALLGVIGELLPPPLPGLVAIDGPILCRNRVGARPVDRETHRRYGRHHAGCHPASLLRHPRPARIARRLRRLGLRLDFRLARPRQRTEGASPLRRQIEVYPHPALVHLLNRQRIIKYKRGGAATRAKGLRLLQGSLRTLLPALRPPIWWDGGAGRSLTEDPRTLRGLERKSLEDRLDAIVCAVVGLLHWWHGGHPDWIEVPGDLESGFIVVPRRSCSPWKPPTPSLPPSTTG